MRHRRCARILLAAALAAGLAASPAGAITGVYVLQSSGPAGSLVQYTVGADGALSPSAPDTALGGGPNDIAVTPDGRFAYVTTTSAAGQSSIVGFARVAANGRLEPNGAAIGPALAPGRGIIVNPQGTRVLYGQPGFAIFWRPINADGTLGAASQIVIPSTTPAPDVRYLAMTADGRNLYAADFSGSASVRIWQFDIDPATGAGTPKGSPVVGWPGPVGGPAVAAGRMAITPSGSHLHLATDTGGAGIGRWAIDTGTGSLTGGTVDGAGFDGYAEPAVAVSIGGGALWAPSGSSASGPERIRQFATGAGGALTPLAPPAVSYVVAGPARDLVASPDGQSLYLGQNGTAGEWTVAPGGTLAHRANTPASPAFGLTNAGIALAPSQAPLASFVAGTGPAGSATLFDARASADPDGTIARYDWDFGDGTGASNAGPTPSHVYPTPGPRTVTLTVTDADGTSTTGLWSGTRMLRNGGPSARTPRAVSVPAAPTVPVVIAPPAAVPQPHKGRSVTVEPERGTLRVRVPGSRRYVPVGSLAEIPLGSIIDARKGRARITAEVDPRTGKTQSSLFYSWFFRILQTKGARPITEARLVKGSFKGCTVQRTTSRRSARRTTRAKSSAASELQARSAANKRAKTTKQRKTTKRSKRTIRKLWGHGNGRFRIGAKRSAATVRGTWWLVTDRCDGTVTRVKAGRVDVRDFARKKTVKLRAPHSYRAGPR